jgi:hypothetical protein
MITIDFVHKKNRLARGNVLWFIVIFHVNLSILFYRCVQKKAIIEPNERSVCIVYARRVQSRTNKCVLQLMPLSRNVH